MMEISPARYLGTFLACVAPSPHSKSLSLRNNETFRASEIVRTTPKLSKTSKLRKGSDARSPEKEHFFKTLARERKIPLRLSYCLQWSFSVGLNYHRLRKRNFVKKQVNSIGSCHLRSQSEPYTRFSVVIKISFFILVIPLTKSPSLAKLA